MAIERKNILFIDNSNIFQSQHGFNKYQEQNGRPRYRIDWKKVLDYFKGENQPIFDSHLFGSHPDPPNALQDDFFRWLSKDLKFQLHLRQLVRRSIRCKKCGEQIDVCPKCTEPFSSLREKGVDVDIAVSLITQADNFDTAILFSGDRDLIGPVDHLRQRGKRVEVYAFSHSITDEYSKRYIPVTRIDDIISKIGKIQKPKESDAPPSGVVITEDPS